MPEDPVLTLLKQSAISFVGTVERLGAATMSDVPIDNHTAVVRVDQVLHAPDAFASLAGTAITVQLAPKVALPKEGEQYTFFAIRKAFGNGGHQWGCRKFRIKTAKQNDGAGIVTRLLNAQRQHSNRFHFFG